MQELPEQWKQYDENYWVSDLGRVKRIYKNGKERYLKLVKRYKNDTALRVKINNKYISIRRLVWQMFRGDIPDGYGVVNKNGCHTMNDVYNLKLMPIKKCNGLGRFSSRRPIIDLDTGHVYQSCRQAEKYLYMNSSTINSYCNNKVAKPFYNLEYFDEEKKYDKPITFIGKEIMK